MTSIWQAVTDVYDEYMASGDPRVTKWPLMESPVPTFVLVSLYVLLVKVIGPAWMMDRKPFDLRFAMFVYNMGLVIANIFLIEETFKLLLYGSKNLACRIDDPNNPDALRLAEMGWYFFFLKFIEFTDTVFFLLRKKFQQISTLHLVHHALVPIAVWFGFRVEPGNYNYFFPLVNTVVHSVMYTYYGLSALGPGVQKYLWWKKYLTTFQMAQFVLVFLYIVTLNFTRDCKVSKFIIYLNIFLAGLFLIMFFDFFRNTYMRRKGQEKKTSQLKVVNGHKKESLPSQRLSMTFNGKELEQSLEKKIG